MKTFLKVCALLAILSILYFGISWYGLNGKIVYWTSYNEESKSESINSNLFVTDKLQITTQGNSLAEWENNFEIWTNKRHEIKYIGFLFHWTYYEPDWRYLNIIPTTHQWFLRKVLINDYGREYGVNPTGGTQTCCNRIACKVGDTITVEFSIANDQGIPEQAKITVLIE